MTFRLLPLLLLSFVHLFSSSQTYTGAGGIIHDYTKNTFLLSVNGLNNPTLDSTFGLKKYASPSTTTAMATSPSP